MQKQNILDVTDEIIRDINILIKKGKLPLSTKIGAIRIRRKIIKIRKTLSSFDLAIEQDSQLFLQSAAQALFQFLTEIEKVLSIYLYCRGCLD